MKSSYMTREEKRQYEHQEFRILLEQTLQNLGLKPKVNLRTPLNSDDSGCYKSASTYVAMPPSSSLDTYYVPYRGNDGVNGAMGSDGIKGVYGDVGAYHTIVDTHKKIMSEYETHYPNLTKYVPQGKKLSRIEAPIKVKLNPEKNTLQIRRGKETPIEITLEAALDDAIHIKNKAIEQAKKDLEKYFMRDCYQSAERFQKLAGINKKNRTKGD